MIPFGRGSRGHPYSRFINLQESLCKSGPEGSPDVSASRGEGGSMPHSSGATALFRAPPMAAGHTLCDYSWGVELQLLLSIPGLQSHLARSGHVLSSFLMSPVRLHLDYPRFPIKLKSAPWQDNGNLDGLSYLGCEGWIWGLQQAWIAGGGFYRIISPV